jgi:hypothetical protein
MTRYDDHGSLPTHAARMLEDLEKIERRHVYGKSSNMITRITRSGRASSPVTCAQ